MRTLRVLPLLALAILLSGCASGGSGSSSRTNPDLITAEELETVSNLTAYDAIQRLRPRWLQARAIGESPVVFLNGAQMGGLDTLRGIQASNLTSIRFRNGRDATTRYGTGFGGGTIELQSQGD